MRLKGQQRNEQQQEGIACGIGFLDVLLFLHRILYFHDGSHGAVESLVHIAFGVTGCKAHELTLVECSDKLVHRSIVHIV